jgi:2'-5' RNA ligase
MRLFIALYPTKEYLDYFRDVMREFAKEKRNLKQLNLEQIHLTLRFVGGKVSPGSKQALAKSLLQHAHQYPKPLIHMESLDFGFKHQDNPRILLASIKANRELDQLIHMLHKQIRDLKRDDTIQWKERIDDNQHISIARLKDAATRSTGRDIKQILSNVHLPYPPDFVATEMYLVESKLTRTGPIYQKLERIEL